MIFDLKFNFCVIGQTIIASLIWGYRLEHKILSYKEQWRLQKESQRNFAVVHHMITDKYK